MLHHYYHDIHHIQKSHYYYIIIAWTTRLDTWGCLLVGIIEDEVVLYKSMIISYMRWPYGTQSCASILAAIISCINHKKLYFMKNYWSFYQCVCLQSYHCPQRNGCWNIDTLLWYWSNIDAIVVKWLYEIVCQIIEQELLCLLWKFYQNYTFYCTFKLY